ncbi:MAG: thiamine-monophosphate kinase [Solirubrobacterales bacterium]|jgi:thiamine-monophosphate kinase|nr:thiamine-monophosphate kinase [Solirubrobacterales bacterium]
MGEFELLAKLRERLPAGGSRLELGSGDDAAVTVPGGATATSVDAIVEGVHFRRGEAGLETIGRKAIATALSDLAAMGGEAGEAYVALGAPGDLGEDEFLTLLDGMLELAAETGTTLAGGDLTRAPVLILAVTVVGHAQKPEQLVSRGGARPGDVVVLTGEIGGAAAGRLLLDDPELATAVPTSVANELRTRQLDPSPRLLTGRALAAAGARAMIDLSDGLAGDAGHLAAASGVALEIESSSLPLTTGVAEIATAAGLDPLWLAASGGEDYELLATLPSDALADASAGVAAAGESSLTVVGQVADGEGVEIRLPGGGRLEAPGYDHFAAPSRGSRSGARGCRDG